MLPPENRMLVTRDGIEVAYLDWDDQDADRLVLFVHATGFCKELCIPIVDDLAGFRSGFRAIAIDQRAHGDSGMPPYPFDWWEIAGDIVELVAAEPGKVVGAGHSSGGAVLAMAEILRPGTFDGLVLVEPIILPPPYGRYAANPMARAARRRRHSFPSRQAAFDSWMTKSAFAGWEPRAMQAYVDGGLRESAGEYVLKCTRESEAEFFMAATEHGAWDRLEEIGIPVRSIAGEHSTTHQEAFLSALADRFENAEYEIIPDSGHMVWMERVGLIAQRIADLLN